MIYKLLKMMIMCLLAFSLASCATFVHKVQKNAYCTQQASQLALGRRLFEEGYYRRSLHQLLPLACDGCAVAQYAIGYMYYYGYGVDQDTDVGAFWIERAAIQHFPPAEQALCIISDKCLNPIYGGRVTLSHPVSKPHYRIY